MKRFFISYDLEKTDPEPHSVLLGLAEKYRLTDWVPTKDQKIKRLPNTTLSGKFETRDEAYSAWKRLVSATARKIGIPVNVEKFLLVQSVAPFAIISDDVEENVSSPKSTALRILTLVREARKKP